MPTQTQIMDAFAVIQSADADDAMALMVAACVAADAHDKLEEAAANIDADHGKTINRMAAAFGPYR